MKTFRFQFIEEPFDIRTYKGISYQFSPDVPLWQMGNRFINSFGIWVPGSPWSALKHKQVSSHILWRWLQRNDTSPWTLHQDLPLGILEGRCFERQSNWIQPFSVSAVRSTISAITLVSELFDIYVLNNSDTVSLTVQHKSLSRGHDVLLSLLTKPRERQYVFEHKKWSYDLPQTFPWYPL